MTDPTLKPNERLITIRASNKSSRDKNLMLILDDFVVESEHEELLIQKAISRITLGTWTPATINAVLRKEGVVLLND